MSSSAPGVTALGSFEPKEIIAGDFPRVPAAIVIAAGSVYLAGTVLGKITASGKCVLVDSAASDGSEDVYGVLAEDIDATAGDAAGIAWLTGEFSEQRLAFGGADTAETHRAAARALSIFFRDAAIQPNE